MLLTDEMFLGVTEWYECVEISECLPLSLFALYYLQVSQV